MLLTAVIDKYMLNTLIPYKNEKNFHQKELEPSIALLETCIGLIFESLRTVHEFNIKRIIKSDDYILRNRYELYSLITLFCGAISLV